MLIEFVFELIDPVAPDHNSLKDRLDLPRERRLMAELEKKESVPTRKLAIDSDYHQRLSSATLRYIGSYVMIISPIAPRWRHWCDLYCNIVLEEGVSHVQ